MTVVEIVMTVVTTETVVATAVVDVAEVAINFDLKSFHKKPIAGPLQLSVFMYVLENGH
jgi:hypothetical protein